MNKNIKKFIVAVLAGATFSCMGVMEVLAAPQYVQITGDPVAVRDNAGTTATFIKQVRYGNRLVYLSEKNDANGTRWYQVKLTGGKKGWVTSVFADTVDEKYVGRVEVDTNLLNVRAGASLTSEILGTTRVGTQYDYFSTKKDDSNQLWYLVHYNDEQTAWLLGTYCKVVSKPGSSGKTDSKTGTKTVERMVELTGSSVVVRSKASAKGEKIATAAKGKKFEYLATGTDEKQQTWYKIQYTSDKSGWVPGSDSKIVKAADKTESKTEKKTTVKQVQITASKVVVRKSASKTSKSLGTTAKGKKFNYLASKKGTDGKTWYQIQYNSKTKGWVISTYSKIITTETTKKEEKTGKKIVEIIESPVNVRASASLNGKKIGITSKGKKFAYLATKKDSAGKTWYQIQYNSKTKGWVLGSLSRIVMEEVKADSKTDGKTTVKQIVITGNPVNVRASASETGKKLGTVSPGKKFKLLSTKKDNKDRTWYQIQYDSKTKGWVLGAFAEIV